MDGGTKPSGGSWFQFDFIDRVLCAQQHSIETLRSKLDSPSTRETGRIIVARLQPIGDT